MSIVITVRNLAELDRALADAPQEIPALIERANTTAAPIVDREIGKKTPYRTGDLFRSEEVFVRGSSLEFRADMPYATYVKDGTTRTYPSGKTVTIPPNPFDEKGAAAAEPQVVAEFEREIDVFVRSIDGP